MTTKKKSRSKTRRNASKQRALTLLAKDHKLVDGLFRKFQKLGDEDEDEKRQLLEQICTMLTVHAELEEELFYPELRSAADDDEAKEILDEAKVEHMSVKALVAELEDADPGDELVSARVTVLAEYVRHHVKEEEGEIFTLARKAKSLDLEELGERMAVRKAELEAETGLEPVGRSATSSPRARARR